MSNSGVPAVQRVRGRDDGELSSVGARAALDALPRGCHDAVEPGGIRRSETVRLGAAQVTSTHRNLYESSQSRDMPA